MADAVELKNLGNKEFMAKNYAQAVEYFTKAIALDAANHVLYSNRSGALCAQSSYAEALADADKTVELKADWPKGHSRRGAALFGLARYADAKAAYEAAAKLEPANAAHQESIRECEQALAGGEAGGNPLEAVFRDPQLIGKLAANPRVAPLLAQPGTLEKLQQLQQNPSLVNMFISDAQIQPIIFAALGLDERMAQASAQRDASGAPPPPSQAPPKQQQQQQPAKKAEPEKPLTEEERAKRDKEAAVNARKEAGNAAYKQRDFETAVAEYAAALELDADNVAILCNMAAVQIETGQYQQCLETAERAIETARRIRADYPLVSRALTRKGTALVHLGDLDQAVEAFKKAMTEFRNPETLKKLNEAEKMRKERDERAYLNPEIAAQEKEKGNECFRLNNNPEAVKHYTEAIKRNPSDHVLYSNRAAAYTRLGALNEALADCDKAIAIKPDFVKIYSRKGAVYTLRKEYHNAMEAYRKGLTYDASNEECREGLEKTLRLIDQSSRGDVDEERVRHAMADPEIQTLMSDPAMRKILQDLSSNPAAAQAHMSNPTVRAKIEKLIAAGIIRTG